MVDIVVVDPKSKTVVVVVVDLKANTFVVVYPKTKLVLFLVPSFEAREVHWYYNNRLDIFRTRAGVV